MSAFKHVLVPTDFGDASERALDCAVEVAGRFGAKVTILHAVALPASFNFPYERDLAWLSDELESDAKKQMEALVLRVKASFPDVTGTTFAGEPWDVILAETKACNADLIVMGTHGRRGLSRFFLGSVAEKVVRTSPIPVLTVGTDAERLVKDEAFAKVAADRARR